METTDIKRHIQTILEMNGGHILIQQKPVQYKYVSSPMFELESVHCEKGTPAIFVSGYMTDKTPKERFNRTLESFTQEELDYILIAINNQYPCFIFK